MSEDGETVASRERDGTLRRDVVWRTCHDRRGVARRELQGLTSHWALGAWLPEPEFETFATEINALAWLDAPWPTVH